MYFLVTYNCSTTKDLKLLIQCLIEWYSYAFTSSKALLIKTGSESSGIGNSISVDVDGCSKLLISWLGSSLLFITEWEFLSEDGLLKTISFSVRNVIPLFNKGLSYILFSIFSLYKVTVFMGPLFVMIFDLTYWIVAVMHR